MDPIVDMLNRIRNAQAVGHATVDVPHSNIKYEIAQLMEKHGYISKIERSGRKGKKLMHLELKYVDGAPAISDIKRISKQGQRIYKSYREFKAVHNGRGIAIISTSKGLMTDKEAKKSKLGGEVIAEIW